MAWRDDKAKTMAVLAVIFPHLAFVLYLPHAEAAGRPQGKQRTVET
jgi:hypothetical protein